MRRCRWSERPRSDSRTFERAASTEASSPENRVRLTSFSTSTCCRRRDTCRSPTGSVRPTRPSRPRGARIRQSSPPSTHWSIGDDRVRSRGADGFERTRPLGSQPASPRPNAPSARTKAPAATTRRLRRGSLHYARRRLPARNGRRRRASTLRIRRESRLLTCRSRRHRPSEAPQPTIPAQKQPPVPIRNAQNPAERGFSGGH